MVLKANWPNTQQTLGEAAFTWLRVLVERTGEDSRERVTNGQEIGLHNMGNLNTANTVLSPTKCRECFWFPIPASN